MQLGTFRRNSRQHQYMSRNCVLRSTFISSKASLYSLNSHKDNIEMLRHDRLFFYQHTYFKQ